MIITITNLIYSKFITPASMKKNMTMDDWWYSMEMIPSMISPSFKCWFPDIWAYHWLSMKFSLAINHESHHDPLTKHEI